MPRSRRMVVPGVPHHITQRGNRRQTTFFRRSDYYVYRSLVREHCHRQGVLIWTYCLMPNHVHWVLQPPSATALTQAVAEAHRRYTLIVNRRQGWKGYLWQGRFASFAMDDAHVYGAARYILMNPVRAGLVRQAEQWRFSSARAHARGRSDGVVEVGHLARLVDDWSAFLASDVQGDHAEMLRLHQRTGRPLGSKEFLLGVEEATGQRVVQRRRGRPPKRTPV